MTTQNIRFLAKTANLYYKGTAVCRSNLANTLITDARTAFALLEYQNEERN